MTRKSTLKTKGFKTKGFLQQAPITRIPNEIACIIFTYATSERLTESISPQKFGYCNTEVHISHVCGHWRALSLGQPSLWTDFYYLAYMASPNSASAAQRLAAYLERSGNQLLNLWVDLRCSSQKERNSWMMEKIVENVGRWRQFILTTDSLFPIDTFLAFIGDLAAPNLELFSFETGDASLERRSISRPVTAPLKPLILAGGAPKLAHLWIDTAVARYLPPLSNITNLHIKMYVEHSGYGPTSHFLDSILSVTNLTTLTLDGYHAMIPMIDTPEAPQREITTFQLKALRIRNQTIHRGLINWKSPLLETLILEKVRYGPGSQENTGSHIYSFPNLHALVIIDNEASTRIANVALAQLTSNIKALILSDSRRRPPPGFDSVLDLLDYEFSKQSWPQLQNVTLNYRRMGRVNPSFLCDCLQTRPQECQFVLQLDNSVVEHWRIKHVNSFEALEHLYTLEPLNLSTSTIPIHWPATLNAGPYKKLFEKANTPFVSKYSFNE